MRPSFQLLQVNMLNSRGDREERLQRFIATGAPALADVVTFQELTDLGGTQEAFEELGFPYFVGGSPFPIHRGGFDHVAIASRHPVVATSEAVRNERVLRVTIALGQQLIHVYSAHFAWGSATERRRLLTAEAIEQEATLLEEQRYSGSFTVLGGDLNAVESSRTLRYLRGLDLPSGDGPSTSWLDAYLEVGSPKHAITNEHAVNRLGRQTALSVGVQYPEGLPARRIDYILSRGWRYGQGGEPLAFGMVPNVPGSEYSDHNAIWAKLAL